MTVYRVRLQLVESDECSRVKWQQVELDEIKKSLMTVRQVRWQLLVLDDS